MTIPKLDGGETLALTFTLLLSQLIFLLISFFVLVIMDALVAGNGFASFTTGSWTNPVFAALHIQSPLVTFGAACASGLVLYFYAAWSEKRGMRNENVRQEILTSRQGIAGEMPRLPLPLIIILMTIVGFSEELLFRFLLLGTLFAVLSPLCGSILAAGISIVISSIVFCLVHVFNNGSGPIITWLILGMVLGAVFILTENLAAVMLAHTFYNIAVHISARVEMHRNPDYFGGPIPTKVLMDSEDA